MNSSKGENMSTGLTLDQLISLANQVCEEEYEEWTDDQDTLTEQLEDMVGFGLDGLENIAEVFIRKDWLRVVPHIEATPINSKRKRSKPMHDPTGGIPTSNLPDPYNFDIG